MVYGIFLVCFPLMVISVYKIPSTFVTDGPSSSFLLFFVLPLISLKLQNELFANLLIRISDSFAPSTDFFLNIRRKSDSFLLFFVSVEIPLNMLHSDYTRCVRYPFVVLIAISLDNILNECYHLKINSMNNI